jgi:O-antigen/teichoic acid export membrane protein
VLSVFFSSFAAAVFCWRMDLFPAADAWGRPAWRHFGEIFGFGKDLFLVSVGTQMITATQTMIITRMLGLEAAALWSVGTRAFTLLSQMVYRITDVSGPALGEMIARREEAALRTRYKALIVLTGSLSGFAATAYVLCNSSFVTLWTHGRFAWPPLNDVLLGIWLIILGVLHCHNTFVVLTKQIHFMRYIYFVEGLVFVTAALLVARWGGLTAVIACSIACSTAFSGAYSVWRASRYFDCSVYEVGFRWLAPMGRLLVFLIPLGVLGGWIAGRLAEPLGQLAFAVLHPGSASSAERAIAVAAARLVLNALVAGSGGCYLFLHYGLSHEVQRELLQRAPKRLNPVLRKVFVSSAQ